MWVMWGMRISADATEATSRLFAQHIPTGAWKIASTLWANDLFGPDQRMDQVGQATSWEIQLLTADPC